ncbi:MAG: hypothetical protein KDE14_06495 [Rhodobacteraceae bacterium]|nr:hypothetical protein [Paracoccaceae bacterium]
MNDSLFDRLRDRAGFILAVAATTAWFVIVGAYVYRIGWAVIMGLPVDDLAAFLTAVAAPPVALWLVMTVVEQRREMFELRRRMGELAAFTRQSVQQAETNVRTTSELQAQMKRMAADGTYRLMLQDLAASTAELAELLGVIKGDAVDLSWARFGSGDITAFAQPFLRFAAEHEDLGVKLGDAAARDPRTRSALASVVRGYDRLAAAYADEKSARDLLEDGPLGQAHRIFKQADAAANRGAANGAANDATNDAANAKLAELSRRLDTHAPGKA